MEAARRTGRRTIVAAGGVAANSIIRGDLERAAVRRAPAVPAASAAVR